MQIKVLGFYLFADSKGNMMMPEYIIKDRILSQISTPAQLSTVLTITKAVTTTVSAVITGGFVLNFILAGGLSQILGAIKQLMIIVHVFLICLPYPMTAQVFLAGLMQVVTF